MPTEDQSQADYDGAWKEALQQFLQPFLGLCFTAVEREIDWDREPEFLEQELREYFPGSEPGRQYVDQLVKLFLINGSEYWILLHIEVQAQPDANLPQRLFHYHTRLSEKHGWRVATLCLLADTSPNFRPNAFRWEFFGCSHQFVFPTCKLLDFEEEALESSKNPIAFVVQAHLAAKRTSLDDPLRYAIKARLLKGLIHHGFSREVIVRLFRLIDWLIKLDKTSALEIRREIAQYYDTNNMPYVTSFERIAKEEGHALGLEQGMEQGMEQGRIESLRSSILTLVQLRHAALPEAFSERLSLVNDEALLNQVFVAAVRSDTLADLEKALDAQGI